MKWVKKRINDPRFLVVMVFLLGFNMYLGFVYTEQNSIYGQFELHFLDVGQGDAVLIKSPDNYYGLIDGGKGNTVLEGLKSKLKTGRLEFVMATHPDADHIEGLLKVMEYYDVRQVLWQKHTKQSPVYTEFKRLVYEKKLMNAAITSNNDFRLGCCITVDVLWPENSESVYDIDANDASYAAVVNYQGKQIWLDGDLGGDYQDKLVENTDKKVFIYKVAHHGSNSSSSEYLLKKLMPVYSVVSAGKDNSYGHPSDDVLQRLTEIDTKILRTDTMGTISFINKNQEWWIETEK